LKTTSSRKQLGKWMLVAVGLSVVSIFPLIGIPGAFIYEAWHFLLNTLCQREVIANLSRIGAGAWVIAIYMSILAPFGLPIGYVLTRKVPRVSQVSIVC